MHIGYKIKKNTFQRGFTLIEMVVYIGILTILIGILSSIFTEIVDVQLTSKATSSVNQDGRYLLSKLLFDAKSSSSFTVNAPLGSQGNTLQLTINSINYTYSLDGNNNLQVVDTSTGETNLLNSYDTSISNLAFMRIGNGGSNDTVKVTFTLKSKTKDRTGQETRNFETVLGTE